MLIFDTAEAAALAYALHVGSEQAAREAAAGASSSAPQVMQRKRAREWDGMGGLANLEVTALSLFDQLVPFV